MTPPPELGRLTEAKKNALILALWAQVPAVTARVAELEARLNEPTTTPSNSSLPPSKRRRTGRRGSGAPGRAGAAWVGRAVAARWPRSPISS